MQSGSGRALRSLPHAGAYAGALLFVLLLQAEGCRENATGPPPQSTQAVTRLVFMPGDTLIFDAWGLDPYNDYVPALHTTPLWRVTAVGGSYAGADGVTSITEYPGSSPGEADTIYFRFLSSGDIEEYGFIAGVVRRREGLILVPDWDRIAAFSLPTNGTWTVGTVDSTRTDTLRGTVLGDQGYFIAMLNGVRTVFHGYGVSLSSLDIDYTLVVSDVPPAVLILQELSTPVANGYFRVLNSLITH
jgi:hypothetical protein